MKIGILTYHSANNFGANLQAYSTVGYLKNNGFDPIVIDWRPEWIYNGSGITAAQTEAHKKFIKDYLPCSDICITDSSIIKVIKKSQIEGIVIGSDAVFRQKPFLSRIHIKKKGIILEPRPAKDWLFPNPFWGSFKSLLKEDIPVVAMSVSSQNTQFKYIRGRLKKSMHSALQKFRHITVRDEWTRKMVLYLTEGEVSPVITPDPVFAYNQNITDQVTREELIRKYNLPDKYILVSFRTRNVVSKEWLEKFKAISEKNDIRCVALTMPDGVTFNHPFLHAIEPPLSPRVWYGLIKYSSGYVGENMHPVVVALHNAVPFFAFDSYGIVKYKFFVNERSSKIYDILDNAGFLRNRVNILGKGYISPDPEEVFKQVVEFDTGKCKEFSNNQQEKYNKMMADILDFGKMG